MIIRIIRYLLFPVSLLYGLVVMVRNYFYDKGWFSSRKFPLPVISVGNLEVGGTGKSPMTEYLVRLLKDQHKTAVLSRGYGRKTSGYLELNQDTPAKDGGDEPVQICRKFPDITVAVCADRVEGITRLQRDHEVVILDDAYQHRAVTPGLSILLVDYNKLDEPRLLLPSGNFREPFWGRKRANLVVVTKAPHEITSAMREEVHRRIRLFPGQQLFFSCLHYPRSLMRLDGNLSRPLSFIAAAPIVLLTGIAYPAPLLNHLQKYTDDIIHLAFPDHHTYSKKNIAKLATVGQGRPIITTEKDAQRLRAPELAETLRGLLVYYLPVEARIHPDDEAQFNEIINHYVTTKHTEYR